MNGDTGLFSPAFGGKRTVLDGGTGERGDNSDVIPAFFRGEYKRFAVKSRVFHCLDLAEIGVDNRGGDIGPAVVGGDLADR